MNLFHANMIFFLKKAYEDVEKLEKNLLVERIKPKKENE